MAKQLAEEPSGTDSVFFEGSNGEGVVIEDAPKPKKRKYTKKKKAPVETSADILAAEGWGQLVVVTNNALKLPIEPNDGMQFGMALHRAVSLTWPEISPATAAWIQVGSMAAAMYGPFAVQMFLPPKPPLAVEEPSE